MTKSTSFTTGLRFAAGLSLLALGGTSLFAGLSSNVSNFSVASEYPGLGASAGAGSGEDEEGGFYTSWISYGFTTGAGSAWELLRFDLVGENYVSPGSLNAGLYATDSQGLPVGTALASFSLDGNNGNYYFFVPDSELILDAGTTYAFSIRPTTGSFWLDVMYIGEGGVAAGYDAIDGWQMQDGMGRSGTWMSGGLGTWEVDTDYRGVYSVSAVESASSIPEPSSAALLAAGAALALAGLRRRARHRIC